jgi:fatty acid hydroxylase family protein
MFLTVTSANTLYQFWIHTRVIGRLGPLESVLNTPSNHRVHHGRDPKYIDRNHGGTLIVWDRLFGTYQAEEEEPVYGITKPLASWNPVWANFHYWAELLREARRTPRRADRLRLFAKPPGWRPAGLGGPIPAPDVNCASYRKFDTPLTQRRAAYVFVHFAVILTASAALLYAQARLPLPVLLAGAGFVLLSLVALTALIESRPWAPALEAARLLSWRWWPPPLSRGSSDGRGRGFPRRT